MKKIYLIHGWGGYPENNWFPWLKKELERRNFEVHPLKMPNPDEPKINEWIDFLIKNINVNEETYLIGHSMGCRAIIGFLEHCNKKIKGVIFVAGWIALNNLETDQEKETAKQWTNKIIDYNKVKEKADKFVAIFSNNDPFVPFKINSDFYKNKLNAEIIKEKNKGHFDDEAGIKELPIVVDKLLEMMK
ncbi:MAG: alpha/beta fold hydrolase [Candidatus Pacearchaeota archaeon]